jgi:hypothetical protein
MWLGFAFKRKPVKSIRTFDGGIDDFISTNAMPGTDPFVEFNRDGIPDLIVVKNWGNGGETYLVYSLGKRARHLATLDTIRSMAQFMDVDHDGRCEALTFDPTFFGWQTCNAESAMPFVILKLGTRRFELATSLMKTSPPSEVRQEQMLAAWSTACKTHEFPDWKGRKDNTSLFYLAPQIWRDMLDLIYSGNSRVAFSLLHRFWHHGMYTPYMDSRLDCLVCRETFEKLFLEELSHSAYLSELKQLNQGDARICKLVQREHFSR